MSYRDALNIEELRRMAKKRLPRVAYDFLAGGVDMVFVGRASLYGITAGGEAGARHAIGILRSEIDRVLALLGCPSVRELSADYLWRPDKQGE